MVDNGRTVDIHALNAFVKPSDTNGLTYVVRITNIPDAAIQAVIYARPYYIFLDEATNQKFTVYGDVQYDSYEEMKDVNDGSFGSDWD